MNIACRNTYGESSYKKVRNYQAKILCFFEEYYKLNQKYGVGGQMPYKESLLISISKKWFSKNEIGRSLLLAKRGRIIKWNYFVFSKRQLLLVPPRDEIAPMLGGLLVANSINLALSGDYLVSTRTPYLPVLSRPDNAKRILVLKWGTITVQIDEYTHYTIFFRSRI